MKKLILKLYDKLIICLLFSTFFMASCKDPNPPVPAYGIVPMYGVPASSVVSNQTPHHVNTIKK